MFQIKMVCSMLKIAVGSELIDIDPNFQVEEGTNKKPEGLTLISSDY